MAMTLLADNTADTTDLASVEFTSGIDSTYKLYIFKFIDINPATDDASFRFQCSIDSGSNYNVTTTSTFFKAEHNEDDSASELAYESGNDQAQGTSYQDLASGVGNGSDESLAGVLHLFSPASTTYVKHYYSTFSTYNSVNRERAAYVAGYFNDTNDIDAISFKMSSGNFDGTIKMYGVG